MIRHMDYKRVLENLHEGLYCVDRDRRIIFWNKGAERISGFTAEEVMGSCCYDNILEHVDEYGRRLCFVGCPLSKAMETGDDHVEETVYLHHRDGHRVPVSVSVSVIRDETGQVLGAAEFFRENRFCNYDEGYVEGLRKAALLDHLTGLPNRKYVEMNLGSALEEFRRHGTGLAVLMIDIDHFKRVNDTYGHNVGDSVLKMVAGSTGSSMRAYDLIGRWGGEEFIGIVHYIRPDGLKPFSMKVANLIRNSFIKANGTVIGVTATIGATMARKDDSVLSIVSRADENLYKGKNEGRDCIIIDGEVLRPDTAPSWAG